MYAAAMMSGIGFPAAVTVLLLVLAAQHDPGKLYSQTAIALATQE